MTDDPRPVCAHADTPAPLSKPWTIPDSTSPFYGCDGKPLQPGDVVRASFHGTLHPTVGDQR